MSARTRARALRAFTAALVHFTPDTTGEAASADGEHLSAAPTPRVRHPDVQSFKRNMAVRKEPLEALLYRGVVMEVACDEKKGLRKAINLVVDPSSLPTFEQETMVPFCSLSQECRKSILSCLKQIDPHFFCTCDGTSASLQVQVRHSGSPCRLCMSVVYIDGQNSSNVVWLNVGALITLCDCTPSAVQEVCKQIRLEPETQSILTLAAKILSDNAPFLIPVDQRFAP